MGAKNELRKGKDKLDKDRIYTFLAEKQCNFLMNIVIGVACVNANSEVKSLMNSVLALAVWRLDNASLKTVLYEAMFIVNSRPLMPITINNPKGVTKCWTPNHRLLWRLPHLLLLPVKFVNEVLYARKRWQRVQYLTEKFWNRWRKEYLVNIRVLLHFRYHSPAVSMDYIACNSHCREEVKLVRRQYTFGRGRGPAVETLRKDLEISSSNTVADRN